MPRPVRDAPRVDERGLLLDPPATDVHLGRLAGYDAGRRVRRVIAAVSVLGCLGAALGYVLYTRHAAYARLHPFELPEGTDVAALTDTLHWSSGSARFTLKREVPGVRAIILPDRVLELAEGCDRARLVVDVGDDTVIEVLSGQVIQRPRANASPTPAPAPTEAPVPVPAPVPAAR